MWKNRIKKWGRWFSQTLNVFLLDGNEDETVSSRIGKVKRKNNNKMPKPTGWISFWLWIFHSTLIRIPIVKGHFIKAIEDDEGDS